MSIKLVYYLLLHAHKCVKYHSISNETKKCLIADGNTMVRWLIIDNFNTERNKEQKRKKEKFLHVNKCRFCWHLHSVDGARHFHSQSVNLLNWTTMIGFSVTLMWVITSSLCKVNFQTCVCMHMSVDAHNVSFWQLFFCVVVPNSHPLGFSCHGNVS